MRFEAFNNYLLLTEQLIDFKRYFSILAFYYCKQAFTRIYRFLFDFKLTFEVNNWNIIIVKLINFHITRNTGNLSHIHGYRFDNGDQRQYIGFLGDFD